MTQTDDDPFAPPPGWATDDGELSDLDRERIEYEAKVAAAELEATARLRARERVLAIEHGLAVAWRRWGAQAALLAGGAAVFFLLPWGIWFLFFRTSPHEVTILEREWERTIEILEYAEHDPRSWSEPTPGWGDDEKYVVPDSIRSRREVRSTTCVSRDEDGWCTLEVDNYDDRWYWTEHRWARSGDSAVAGATTAEAGYTGPEWPAPDLGPSTPELGNRRLSESRRWEILEIVMAGDDGVFKWNAPSGDRSIWHRAEVGERATAHFNIVGHVRSIDLEQERVA